MSAPVEPPNLHASAVAFGAQGGVLIIGPSGSGKSTLALALIEQGAQLVADDQTLVSSVGGMLYARAPRSIAGLIEVRGLGLVRVLPRSIARLRLVIDLGQTEDRRLPPHETCTIAGIPLPRLKAGKGGAFIHAIRHYLADCRLTG